MINEVSLQYAKSLYELSTNLEKDLNDLKVLANAILESNELVKVLKHPSISKSDKKEIFKELLKEKVENYFLYFIYVLVDNDRILELDNIYETFKMLHDESKNQVTAYVTTKYELTESTKHDLISFLENKYNKKINLTEKVDNTLIGGIKVVVENEVIDYTIDYQLENIKNTIKG